jgi:hypothetical protein
LTLGFLAAVIVVAAALAIALPDASKLTYPVESGSASAAKGQLAYAQELTKAFQQVNKALKPSVVSLSSVKRIGPTVQQPQYELHQFPEEFRHIFSDDFFDRFLRAP